MLTVVMGLALVDQVVAEDQRTSGGDPSWAVIGWHCDVIDQQRTFEDGEPVLRTDVSISELLTPEPFSSGDSSTIETLVPDARWIELRRAAVLQSSGQRVTIADPGIVDLLDLPDDLLQRLDETGAVMLHPSSGDDTSLASGGTRPRILEIRTDAGVALVDVGPPLSLERGLSGEVDQSIGYRFPLLVIEERAIAEGWRIVPDGFVLDAPQAFTKAERRALLLALAEPLPVETVFSVEGGSRPPQLIQRPDGDWIVTQVWVDDSIPGDEITAMALAAALLLVLCRSVSRCSPVLRRTLSVHWLCVAR